MLSNFEILKLVEMAKNGVINFLSIICRNKMISKALKTRMFSNFEIPRMEKSLFLENYWQKNNDEFLGLISRNFFCKIPWLSKSQMFFGKYFLLFWVIFFDPKRVFKNRQKK